MLRAYGSGAIPRWGGQYDVTYSGGQTTQSVIGGDYPIDNTYDYSINPNDSTYGGIAEVSVPDDALGSVSCDGAITPTFTWDDNGDPNNLPPKSVVIQEDCTAQWWAWPDPTQDYDGGCTNPLGGSLQDYGFCQTWTYTKYSVRSDPGSSFTVTCSPSAYADCGSGGECSADVSYKAQACPVELGLRGTTLDSNGKHNILVGQNCVAFLYSDNLLPGVNFGLPTWTIPSETYTSFNISEDQSTGTAVPFPDPSSTDPL